MTAGKRPVAKIRRLNRRVFFCFFGTCRFVPSFDMALEVTIRPRHPRTGPLFDR